MTRFVLCALLLSLTTACGGGDSPTAPSAPPEVTGSAPFSTIDLVTGTGAVASSGQLITVSYAGWLYSDTAAENKGRQFAAPAGIRFTLGTGQVIRGWDQGIPGMAVGGRRRIVIPPDLAYGAAGRAPEIPPNATLLFEVELVSIP